MVYQRLKKCLGMMWARDYCCYIQKLAHGMGWILYCIAHLPPPPPPPPQVCYFSF